MLKRYRITFDLLPERTHRGHVFQDMTAPPEIGREIRTTFGPAVITAYKVIGEIDA